MKAIHIQMLKKTHLPFTVMPTRRFAMLITFIMTLYSSRLLRSKQNLFINNNNNNSTNDNTHITHQVLYLYVTCLRVCLRCTLLSNTYLFSFNVFDHARLYDHLSLQPREHLWKQYVAHASSIRVSSDV